MAPQSRPDPRQLPGPLAQPGDSTGTSPAQSRYAGRRDDKGDRANSGSRTKLATQQRLLCHETDDRIHTEVRVQTYLGPSRPSLVKQHCRVAIADSFGSRVRVAGRSPGADCCADPFTRWSPVRVRGRDLLLARAGVQSAFTLLAPGSWAVSAAMAGSYPLCQRPARRSPSRNY